MILMKSSCGMMMLMKNKRRSSSFIRLLTNTTGTRSRNHIENRIHPYESRICTAYTTSISSPFFSYHGSSHTYQSNRHHQVWLSTISSENVDVISNGDDDVEDDDDDAGNDSIPSPPPPTATTSRLMMQNTNSSNVTRNKLFQEIDNLHPILLETIQALHLREMTEIQMRTWDAAIRGTDVIGRSRTGSGKTLAFLLPSIQRIIQMYQNDTNSDTTTNTTTHKNITPKVKILIISPTRELAHQIYTTTVQLTNQLKRNTSPNLSSVPPMHCQVLFGGTPKPLDIQKMTRNIPTIITSTPGRLLDHLQSSVVNNVSFEQLLQDIEVLILDEMDLLLDMGFRDDIQRILQFLSSPPLLNSNNSMRYQPPPQQQRRQTLLFSATLPLGVKDMVRQYIRKDYVMVDCIQDNDPTSHTVSTVDQSYVILPPEKMIVGTIQTILQLMKSDLHHKIIVFFPTTSQVSYYSNVFNHALGRRVIEIHSGISQGTRTNRSDNFRHSKTSAVLFTSDVSARGVDYPDVTHVLQVGPASNRETYIHRLGRTGRAGKSGQGILLLLPTEVEFIRRDLKDINIPVNSKIQNVLKMDVEGSGLENHIKRIHDLTESSRDFKQSAIGVYKSSFGYYAQRLRSMHVPNFESTLVTLLNGFAQQTGLKDIPALSHKVASQYGLQNHPALNIQRQWDTGGRNFDVGYGGGRGGGRGRGGRNMFNERPPGSFSRSSRNLGYEQRFLHNNATLV